ncbi:MAG: GNAT family N-acetyltransferase, partial [Acidobacteriota bacterium]|nr:GNAT family N-acetyltransferase [Acidobacteriota bacterium]
MSPAHRPAVAIRPATPEDAALCGRICYDAFSAINAAHGFPCDFPHAEAAQGVLSAMFSHPNFYCVVAELDGRVVGSNCLDERAIVAGL